MKSYSNSDLAEFLVKFQDHLTCWKVGLSIGSMLYFEMGQQWVTISENNAAVLIGSTTLALEFDKWTITQGTTEIAASDSITEELVGSLIWKYFIGHKLEFIEYKAEQCLIIFDRGSATASDIRILLTGEADEDLCTITFPDGTIIACNAKDGFNSDSSISESHVVAYTHWKALEAGKTAPT